MSSNPNGLRVLLIFWHKYVPLISLFHIYTVIYRWMKCIRKRPTHTDTPLHIFTTYIWLIAFGVCPIITAKYASFNICAPYVSLLCCVNRERSTIALAYMRTWFVSFPRKYTNAHTSLHTLAFIAATYIFNNI